MKTGERNGWSTHSTKIRGPAEYYLDRLGLFEFFIEAWNDRFSKKLQDIIRWLAAGEDVSCEVAALVDQANEAAGLASPTEKMVIQDAITNLKLVEPISRNDAERFVKSLSDKSLSSVIIKNLGKDDYTSSKVFTVIVDRSVARYSTWYEMFHRSQGTIPNKSGTFKDCESRLVEIKKMGFDVVYLPPIHPIGHTNRRGPNNTKSQSKEDPGSPWAIGSEIGGYDAVNPDIGTIEDFENLISRADELGIEDCPRSCLSSFPRSSIRERTRGMVLSQKRWYNPLCRKSPEEILRHLSIKF